MDKQEEEMIEAAACEARDCTELEKSEWFMLICHCDLCYITTTFFKNIFS